MTKTKTPKFKPADQVIATVVSEWMNKVKTGERVDSQFSRDMFTSKIVEQLTEAGLLRTVPQVAVTADELAGQIAVGVHTGLRKGSEAPSSADLWQAISKSKDSAWTDAANFCAYGLEQMGYTVTKDPE